MKNIINFLDGKKSYIVAAVTFLYAVVIVGWQQNNWSAAFDLILGSGGLASIRAAINKV